MSAPQRVLLKPVTPAGRGLRFELMGDDQLSGGVGGWETLPRPRRTSVAVWAGTPPRSYVLPLQLDGLEAGGIGRDLVVEDACRRVESWGRSTQKKGVTIQPAILQVTGPVKVPPGARWVINEIEWGPCERNRAGKRIQQDLTITLLQYRAPVIVSSPAKRLRQQGR